MEGRGLAKEKDRGNRGFKSWSGKNYDPHHEVEWCKKFAAAFWCERLETVLITGNWFSLSVLIERFLEFFINCQKFEVLYGCLSKSDSGMTTHSALKFSARALVMNSFWFRIEMTFLSMFLLLREFWEKKVLELNFNQFIKKFWLSSGKVIESLLRNTTWTALFNWLLLFLLI